MRTENANPKPPASKGRKRKATGPPSTNARSPRLFSVVGKLEGEDAVRATALGRLPKKALLGYYAHLRDAGLFTGELAAAPPQEEWNAAWDATSVAKLCASVELKAPTPEQVRQGVYDPPPAAPTTSDPLVLEVRRTTPRTPPASTAAATKTPAKETTHDPDVSAAVAALESKLEQSQVRETMLTSRLDALEKAGGNNNKGLAPRTLAFTPPGASPSVPPEHSEKAQVLPPELNRIFLSLPMQVRAALFAGSHIPLARFRPQSFVQSLAAGTKATLEVQPDGSYAPVASGKHSPLAEHEFDHVFTLYHALDLYLRPERAIANAKDKLLVQKVRKMTIFSEFYDWYELAAMAASATKPYAGLAPPDQDQWALWYSDLASRMTRPSSTPPAALGPAPTAPAQRPGGAPKTPSPTKGTPLPKPVLLKACAEGFCIKFQRAYCSQPASHVEMVGPEGRKVSTTLQHLCFNCGASTHGWNACPTRPA